MDLKE